MDELSSKKIDRTYPIESEISITQEIIIGLCEMQNRTPTMITERIIIQAYTILNELIKEIDPSHSMKLIQEKAKALANKPEDVHQYINFMPRNITKH